MTLQFLRYVVLPPAMTPFERAYVTKMNRIAMIFFTLHVPALMLIAWANGTRPWLAGLLSAATLAGPALASKTLSNPRSVSVVWGVAAMFFGGLLVHFGQGPMQIEMHFYFFALIAMLAVFGNPLVIVAAAVTVALHHLALWFLVRSSVFNYDAQIWVVAVHAAFVVLESVAAVYIARSFFDNVIGLEKIVQSRTAELDRRNQDMRLVLDNVEQALVTVDVNGVLSSERSAAFTRWFGSEGDSIFSVFARHAPDFADRLEFGWGQLVEDFLPREMLIDQLPKSFAIGEIHYAVEYLPVRDGAYLIVVTDVTAEMKHRSSERERRETWNLFERALVDRSGIHEYFEEGAVLVKAIADSQDHDRVELNRHIHTLKGMSAIFRLESVVELAHALETDIAETGDLPTAAARALIGERFHTLYQSFESIIGRRGRVIEITPAEHEALESEARSVSYPLWKRIHALALEPTRSRFDHYAEHAQRIADRLDKKLDIVIDDQDVRLEREWAPLWSVLVHAVRNAVDHGIESPEERAAGGKSETGTIVLRSRPTRHALVIEISDDGRGIDWQRVRDRASSAGLPIATQADLENALFHDGLSTATTVTHVSGRGIGMGALRATTRALGGRLVLESARGAGTTVRMIFPTAFESAACAAE